MNAPTKVLVSNARGESFGDTARRVGTIAGVPVAALATDAEILDSLSSGLAAVVAAAGYTIIAHCETGTSSANGDGNITLSGEQTIAGILTSTSRVLLTTQTDPAENGIWVTAAGAWSRATDFNETSEVVQGSYVEVTDGYNAGAYVLVTADPITVGTTAQTWNLFRLDKGAATAQYLATTTYLSGTVAKELQQTHVHVDSLGALADGSDDASVINSAATLAVTLKSKLKLSPGKTYTFSQISFPAGLVIEAAGAILRYDGSLTGSNFPITFGDGVRFDSLTLSSSGAETNTAMISMSGDGVWGDEIIWECDAQRSGGGGIEVYGEGCGVGHIKTVKVDRPLHVDGTGLGSPLSGFWCGFSEAESWVRAFRGTNCEKVFIDRKSWIGKSPNASKTPGHNGALCMGMSRSRIGPGPIDGCGEHAIRLGGSTEGNFNGYLDIDASQCENIGGCLFKANDSHTNVLTGTMSISSGAATVTGVGTAFTTELELFDTIGMDDTGETFTVSAIASNTSLTVTRNATNTSTATTGFVCVQSKKVRCRLGGTNINDGTPSGNTELIRATHVRELIIEVASSGIEGNASSSQMLLQLNDARNVYVYGLNADKVQSAVLSLDYQSDANPADVRGVYLYGVDADIVGGNRAISIAMGVHNYGDIFIENMSCTGFSTDFAQVFSGTRLGEVEIRASITGSVVPTMTNFPDHADCYAEILWNGRLITGRPSSMDFDRGLHAITAGATSLSDTTDTPGYFVNSVLAAAGLNNYGGGYFISPPGSKRRGVGVIVKQTSSSFSNSGIAFVTRNAGVSATDALFEAAVLSHGGNLSIVGAISKGSGTFQIDHPLDPYETDLIHGFVEGPRYDLLYRGRAVLEAGRAVVDIDVDSRMSPGTFAALTQNAEVCALNNVTGFARVLATPVENGKFEIVCEDKKCTDAIVWLVMAERADPFIRTTDWVDASGRLVPEQSKPDAPDDGAVRVIESDDGQLIEIMIPGVKGAPWHQSALERSMKTAAPKT